MTITPEHTDLLNIRLGLNTIEMSGKGVKQLQLQIEGTSVVLIVEPMKSTWLLMPSWFAPPDYTHWVYTVDISPFWISLVESMNESPTNVKLESLKSLCDKAKVTEHFYQMSLHAADYHVSNLLREGKVSEAQKWLSKFEFKPEDLAQFIINFYVESVKIGRRQIKDEISEL